MKHVVIGIVTRINSEQNKEYLLIQAKKDFGEFTGYYYPPGGHTEDGETEEQALKREIFEELNIEIKILNKITQNTGDLSDQIVLWYECEYTSGELIMQEDEISDARYFTKEEIEKLKVWPATRNIFEEFILTK